MLTRVPGQELLPVTCGRGGKVGTGVAVGRTCVGLAVTTSGVEISVELSSECVGVKVAAAAGVCVEAGVGILVGVEVAVAIRVYVEEGVCGGVAVAPRLQAISNVVSSQDMMKIKYRVWFVLIC
jgi:hypothetical protein